MVAESLVSRIREGTLNLIFPPKCLKCRATLSERPFFSSNAHFEIPPKSLNRYLAHRSLTSLYCLDCLHAFGNDDTDKMGNIHDSSRQDVSGYPEGGVGSVRRLTVAGPYDGLLKESIHLLKYGRKMTLASPLGRILFFTFLERYPVLNECTADDPFLEKAPAITEGASFYQDKGLDLIVPIPLYRWRMLKRGFNQAFLLVREFDALWQEMFGAKPPWVIDCTILVRKKNTKSQTGFTREERHTNVKDAFKINEKRRIQGKSVLLVDDVHTTGATTAEAARVLCVAGAASVDVLVLAKA